MMYIEKISELFKNIPVTIPGPKPGDYTKKRLALFKYIGEDGILVS